MGDGARVSYLAGVTGIEYWFWEESMMRGGEGKGEGRDNGEQGEILKGSFNQVHTGKDQLPHQLFLRRHIQKKNNIR